MTEYPTAQVHGTRQRAVYYADKTLKEHETSYLPLNIFYFVLCTIAPAFSLCYFNRICFTPNHNSNMISPVWYLNDPLQLIVSMFDTSVLHPRPHDVRFFAVFSETYYIRLQASATRLQKPHLTAVKYFGVWLCPDWLTGGLFPSGSSAEALVSLKGV